MNSNQTLADRLAIYLAAYKHYVAIKSKARLQDGAIFGEALARDLAEIVFDYKDLVNLNLKTSFPAIDLGSAAAGCANSAPRDRHHIDTAAAPAISACSIIQPFQLRIVARPG